MNYLGDFAAGASVHFKFTTNAAAGSRVDFNNALEAGDIRVYKNGSATERSSTAGFTVTSGFDSLVGVHHVTIDTSDNTDAGFYAAGNDYQVVLYPDETVDGLNVAAVLASFSIENRKADVGRWLGTALATPDTAGYPKVTVKDGTGAGEIDTAGGKVSLVAGDITSIQSGLATESLLTTVAGYIDTEIGTIISLLAAGRVGLASEGVLDAGSATTFTLPAGGIISRQSFSKKAST